MAMDAPTSPATTTHAKKYFLVSADCHVLEPPDLWERRIEPKFRPRLPRVEVDAKGHKILTVEGARPLRIRDFTLEGEDLERTKGGRSDLDARLRDLDRDGIDAEVIYPNRGLLMWASPALAHQAAMCKVWNDWALDFLARGNTAVLPLPRLLPKMWRPRSRKSNAPRRWAIGRCFYQCRCKTSHIICRSTIHSGPRFRRPVCRSVFMSAPAKTRARRIGIDNLSWGDDYPHHEGTWPRSQEVIDRTMSDLTEDERQKVLGFNAAKLYGFAVKRKT